MLAQVDLLSGGGLLAWKEGFDREYAATVREIAVLRELQVLSYTDLMEEGGDE